MFCALALPAFVYAKPRLPPTQTRASNNLDLSFLKNQAFWLFIVANLIQAFANFLPGIYIPCEHTFFSTLALLRASFIKTLLCYFPVAFAHDLKLSNTSGTLALSLMNGK